MEGVKQADQRVGLEIEDLMFVFENLVDVDDKGIQTLLREVSSENLLMALKGADDVLKEKVFRNMSKRAAEVLREDLEGKGPVRLSEVQAAQKEVLNVARRLSESGQIALGGAGGEAMI
jgi:flagellar motor switch protein FliG